MKSLKDQLADKCIHFNGVMNNECKVGVKYSDVRVDLDEGPYKFPCLKQAGECACAKFRTEEEVDAAVKEIEESGVKVAVAIEKIRDHFERTKKASGKIACECGGELHYAVALTNGHIRANCNSCKMSFIE